MPTVKIQRPRYRMSATDAGFLYLERPHAPLHIGSVAIVDGALTAAEVARRIERRLARVWRYAQRPLSVPLSLAHPIWEDAPDFDVLDHVHGWGLPSPGGEFELLDTIARLLSQPLDRSRPLWEIHVLEGLAGGRTVVFQKVHHCMIDGVSGARLLEELLDPSPDSDCPPAARSYSTRSDTGSAGMLAPTTPSHTSCGTGSPRSPRGDWCAPCTPVCTSPPTRFPSYPGMHLWDGDVGSVSHASPWRT
jgi:WS/DGAT/MGAT family acyltransferase